MVTLNQSSGSPTIFRLPAGYRPAHKETHLIYNSNSSPGRLEVQPSGNVHLASGQTVGAADSLDGIVFRAAG